MYRQRYPDAPGMHHTEGRRHTHIERGTTFGDRIKASLCATIIGVILVPAALFLLGWNEGRAVRTAQSLEEGFASVTELTSAQVVEPQLNGRLVHLSGGISCDGLLNDPVHGVAVSAVSLKKTVEMYQWVETEHRDERELSNGDKEVTKSYSYDTYWRSDLVRSSSFDSPYNHNNPDSMPIKSETYTSSKVNLGAFSLSSNLIGGISSYKDFRPSVVPDHTANIKIADKYFYHGINPSNPQVGDVRVSFSYAGLCKNTRLGPAQVVSVMAMQQDFTLTGYQTQAGNVLEMISMDHKSAWDMIQTAHSQNTMLTWFLRGVGMFINFLGFTCLTSLIRTLVSYVPIVRELVYLSIAGFNISLSVSLSLFTIAISWIYFRPAMALAIVALSAAFILLPRSRVQPPQYTTRYQT